MVEISTLQCPLVGVNQAVTSCFRIVDYPYVHESWFIPIITTIVVLD